LLSSLGDTWVEHQHQSTVLMFLIDGTLPRPLNKHFRLHISNRVTWRNIQRLDLDLDLSDFMAAHYRLDDPGFEPLLAQKKALSGQLGT